MTKAFNLPTVLSIVLTVFIMYSCGDTTSKEDKEETSTTIEAKDSANSKFDNSLAIPDFTMATIQDSTAYSNNELPKDGLLLINYFSPDCEHCQEEATIFFENKDELQNIKTVWIAGEWMDLQMVREFAENYKLDQFNAVAVGKETSRTLLNHYQVAGLPYAAVYKDNQLLTEFRATIDFEVLKKVNNGTFKPEMVEEKEVLN